MKYLFTIDGHRYRDGNILIEADTLQKAIKTFEEAWFPLDEEWNSLTIKQIHGQSEKIK